MTGRRSAGTAPESVELWRARLPERLAAVRLLVNASRMGLAGNHRDLARRLVPLGRQLQQLARQAAQAELDLPVADWLDAVGDALMTIQQQLTDCAKGALERGGPADPCANYALRELLALLREASELWQALLTFYRGAA